MRSNKKKFTISILLFPKLKVLLFTNKYSELEPKTIIIYKLGSIGDVICSVPAMYIVRRKFPKSKLILLTATAEGVSASKVLKNVQWIDEIISYDVKAMHNIHDLLKFIKYCRSRGFDYLINMPEVATTFKTQLRNLLFFKTIGIKAADGFYISELKWWPHVQMKYINRPKEVLRLVNALPFKHDGKIEYDLGVSDKDKIYVDKYLQKIKFEDKNNLLAISFSGKGDSQKWSLDNFAKIAKLWVTKRRGKVVVVGGKNDIIGAEYILKDIPHSQGYNLAGVFTIQESLVLLQHIKIMLGIDTGTAHMAASVDARAVIIFTAYDFPNQWEPYGSNIIILRKDLDCSPCLSKNCKYGFPAKCMQAITVEEVWKALNAI